MIPIKHPDPMSFKRLHPRNRRDIAERFLNGTPGGVSPVVQRGVTHPGNISMYDHLQNIRQQAIADLEVKLNFAS